MARSVTVDIAAAPPGSDDAPLVVPLETPDGSVGLCAPLGRAVEIKTGILPIADDLSTLSACMPTSSPTPVSAPAPAAEKRLHFPGLEGHGSGPSAGDAELRVLRLDESTLVALTASRPPGEWSQFSPLFEAMLASVRVP